MSKYRIIDMMIHLIFIGLFVILFILLFRIDEKQDIWYDEDKIWSASIEARLKIDEKVLNKIDRRLAIPGCLLK